MPRRPREDAAPARPRRHPRRPPARGSPQAARRARRRAVRAGRREPLSRSSTPSRPVRLPTSASSRSTSAVRRWCAPQPRTTRASPSSPSPSRYADVLAAVEAGGFELETRKRLAGEAFAHTAAYDVAVASWFASSYAPADSETFPQFLGATLAARRRAALRREPAPGGRALHERLDAAQASRRPSSCTASRCPTTTTSTRTPPVGPPTTSRTASVRASRSSSTPTRAASPSAPTSPRRTARRTRATRSRRSAASSPPTRP